MRSVMSAEHDRTILRGLAEKQAAIAALPIQKATVAMWQRMNRLEPGKPMVWITEIPWSEMGPELELQTEDPFCREIEHEFRATLYQWEHCRGDMVVEGKFGCPLVVHGYCIGPPIQARTIPQGAHDTISSRQYEPVIRDEPDIEKIQMPQVVPDWNATEEKYQRMAQLFGDILPVEKYWPSNWVFGSWDDLAQWWGPQEALMDLMLRPEMCHRAMERLLTAYLSMLDQFEELGLITLNNGNIRCGSGGPGFTDLLPQKGFNPQRVRAQDLWGFATSQIFSEVSPEMHWEFALQYELRWLKRFGLTYYGCCEPLHDKMRLVSKIPNLRRVSMSPRANVEKGAAAIGNRYVFSHKPNPAIFAWDRWNPQAARAALRDTLEKTRGCIVEIVMKDISTVRHDPQRLWEWATLASEITAEFA
ncbi:MAG: hypothetical protein HY360_20455 [Verrucomicrobia bacterium]|nr:hypothetical protein [Verrucomicrobiota bacterium]